MSARRRFASALSLSLFILVASAAAVFAQGGAPNPSGGTRLCPATTEGSGAVTVGQFLSKGFSIEISLRAWMHTIVAMQIAPTTVRTSTVRTKSVRRVWSS